MTQPAAMTLQECLQMAISHLEMQAAQQHVIGRRGWTVLIGAVPDVADNEKQPCLLISNCRDDTLEFLTQVLIPTVLDGSFKDVDKENLQNPM